MATNGGLSAAGSGWLNADQASAYLGLPSRGSLYERVRRGQIRAHKWGRSLRFRVADLDAAVLGRTPLAAEVNSAFRRPSAKEGA